MPTVTFKNFYHSLPPNTLEDFRTDVCNICGFSITTFYRRINDSEDLFSPAEKAAIAKLVKKPVNQIFAQ